MPKHPKQSVRLTPAEIQGICDVFARLVGAVPATLWLFGSRVDTEKRGGDIDLFLELAGSVDNVTAFARKIRVALYDQIGERKIDLVIKTPAMPASALYDMARLEGVLLWENPQI